jgi:hypothetical protein
MAGHVGTVRKAARATKYSTIDNTRYAYWLQCQIHFDARGTWLTAQGIYGADAKYDITAANR